MVRDSDKTWIGAASGGACTGTGVDAFVCGVSEVAWRVYLSGEQTSHFVGEIADRYAFIRLDDITRPVRFLRQMAGAPPVQLGDGGFRADLLDDYNPARHYTALLFVGYHAPAWLAVLILYAWEIAGFVRYRGQWSWPDIRSGLVGVRHGRLVRTYGPTVLPALIAAQLAEKSEDASWEGVSSGSDESTPRAA